MALSDDELRAFLRDTSRYPPCARHLGFEPIGYSVEAGWAEVAFSPRPFANPAGSVLAVASATAVPRPFPK